MRRVKAAVVRSKRTRVRRITCMNATSPTSKSVVEGFSWLPARVKSKRSLLIATSPYCDRRLDLLLLVQGGHYLYVGILIKVP